MTRETPSPCDTRILGCEEAVAIETVTGLKGTNQNAALFSALLLKKLTKLSQRLTHESVALALIFVLFFSQKSP